VAARCVRSFFIAAVVLALLFSHMPHSRTAAGAARRTDRAIRLGFVQRRDADRRHVQVPAHLAQAVKSMACSLAVHDRHAAQVGVQSHYARNATRLAGAAGAITQCEMQKSLDIHRVANKAKHDLRLAGQPAARASSWADASEGLADCSSSPPAGGVLSAEVVRRGRPLLADAYTQTEPLDPGVWPLLEPCGFLCSSPPAPGVWLQQDLSSQVLSGDFVRDTTFQLSDAVDRLQAATSKTQGEVAVFAAQVEKSRSVIGGLLEAHIKLAASLSVEVQARVDERFSTLTDSLLEKFRVAAEGFVAASAATVTSSFGHLLTKLPDVISAASAPIRADVDALKAAGGICTSSAPRVLPRGGSDTATYFDAVLDSLEREEFLPAFLSVLRDTDPAAALLRPPLSPSSSAATAPSTSGLRGLDQQPATTRTPRPRSSSAGTTPIGATRRSSAFAVDSAAPCGS